MIQQSDSFSKVMGWIGIVFFGSGIPISLFIILDRRPQIIINEVGIMDRTLIKDFINWNLIEDAYLVNTGKKFICIVLKPDTDLTKYHTVLFKIAARLNKSFGFQELNINLAFIKINESQLANFVRQMSKATNEERGKLMLNWNQER